MDGATTDPTLIQIIIQAGAVGLALFALFLVWQCIKILTNHLAHVSEILGDVSATLRELLNELRSRK
jgi:hypothetical protein